MKVQLYILVGLAFSLPWFSFAIPRAAATLVPLFTVLSLGVVFWQGQWSRHLRSNVWMGVLAVLVLGTVSLLWSLDAELSTERLTKLVLFLPVGTALVLIAANWSPGEREVRTVDGALLAGMSFGALLLAWHLATETGLFGLLRPDLDPVELLNGANRPSVILLLCLSAAVLAMKRTVWPRLAWGYVALLMLLFSQATSQTAAFGLVIWLAGYAVAWAAPAIARSLLVWGGAALILAMPGLVLLVEHFDTERSFDYAAGSAGARLDLWYAVSHKVLDSPLYGYGLEGARSITDWAVEFVYFNGNSVPHPHNGVLQIWLELGLIGALLAALIWVLVTRKVRWFRSADQPALIAGLGAFLVVLSVSHGLWQSWWLNAAFGVAALTLLFARRASAERPEAGRAG